MNIPKIKKPGKIVYHFEDMEKGCHITAKNQTNARSIQVCAKKRGFKIIIRTMEDGKIKCFFMGKKQS